MKMTMVISRSHQARMAVITAFPHGGSAKSACGAGDSSRRTGQQRALAVGFLAVDRHPRAPGYCLHRLRLCIIQRLLARGPRCHRNILTWTSVRRPLLVCAAARSRADASRLHHILIAADQTCAIPSFVGCWPLQRPFLQPDVPVRGLVLGERLHSGRLLECASSGRWQALLLSSTQLPCSAPTARLVISVGSAPSYA